MLKINHLMLAFMLAVIVVPAQAQKNYKNFKVAVYSRSYETKLMADEQWLDRTWTEVTNQLKVDKIYLETHRDLVMVDQKTLDTAKAYFKKKGVEMAGGITWTIDESNNFETFCYSNPEHRKKVQEIIEFTAKNFDEVIFDDFFFTSCKSDIEIKAKGNKSWTQYRLDLMTEVTKNIMLASAKKVNPNVKVIVKYPNWYEHFQGLGFNLETEPKLFDGIYTGTETRDATLSAQHLQEYLGYEVIRYFENIAPGRNGGGWVDPFGIKTYDRYGEQLWLTLFAKAPQVALFDLKNIQAPLTEKLKASWQGTGTSFDYAEMMKPVQVDGKSIKPTTIARVAGITFEKVDKFLGELGNPVGLKSYKPFHSTGEDFLQNFLGNAGIPIEMVPYFPKDENVILLTESAKFDQQLVPQIKAQLTAGKKVVITSGLLKAIQDKLSDIVELQYTDRKALVKDFFFNGKSYHGDKAILIPQIQYLTNDSWEVISSYDGPNGWPLLHGADYSKGRLLVLAVPENFADLSQLPAEVLTKLKRELSDDKTVLEGPGQMSLFLYDNNTLIVQSYRDAPVDVKVSAVKEFTQMKDILTNEVLKAEVRKPDMHWGKAVGSEKSVFSVTVKPHSYRVFKLQ
ncbi:permease [Cellvibrio zantedeschiae]|uniref:Permease n=1 Tax=Cellvibrio zantedeschiae TaxID=1237077 RepID=A0ABQ3B3Y9_9GAMM|nr:hypothetical protein [Cellvibrio zantedeschiae]GGY77373.1 permease [Cellvibrio zantedeschiae]